MPLDNPGPGKWERLHQETRGRCRRGQMIGPAGCGRGLTGKKDHSSAERIGPDGSQWRLSRLPCIW